MDISLILLVRQWLIKSSIQYLCEAQYTIANTNCAAVEFAIDGQGHKEIINMQSV